MQYVPMLRYLPFLQLWMVVGARGHSGQSVLTAVVKGHKRELEVVLILPLQMVEPTVVEKRRRSPGHVIKITAVSP